MCEGCEMTRQFREGIRNREFFVRYQPQFCLETGKMCGAEALVRWKRKEGVIIPPARFIPEFERLGIIVELDAEVLGIVCSDLCEAKKLGIRTGPVSINLSRLHMIRKGIPEKIRRFTEIYGIGNSELAFELTESAAYPHDRADLKLLVDSMREQGYRVALDDYGIGYSSLKLLAETEFDILKLDRFFVGQIGDQRTEIILRVSLELAGSLGMEVIAEGVETDDQVYFLKENGCRAAQGYYYSKPLSKDAFFRKAKEGKEENVL